MRILGTILLALTVAVCTGGRTSSAQETTAKAKPETPPAFAPPLVDEKLPNVLLLGDSISIGYMLDVRKQLAGAANVWRPATNCGPTTRGLELLEDWIDDQKWEVIHWNFGLHDLKYMGPNGENLTSPDGPNSHQQVPIDQYAANLKQIAERLRKTGAKLVWCETTPVPEGSKGRVAGDAKKYNEAAANVMQELGDIEIDRLYRFAIEQAEQRSADVHFTPAGSAKLAEQVSKSIRTALNK